MRTTTSITDLAVVVDVVGRNIAVAVVDVGWVVAVVAVFSVVVVAVVVVVVS